VGTIAAITGAAIVYVCLNYGHNVGGRKHSPSPEPAKSSVHEILHKTRYNKDAICVEHHGSCHCSRIRFQILAPADIVAVDVPSKIRFPRLTVPCSSFQFLSRQEDCSLYSVTAAGGGDHGIHTFCSYCGMHVVYAPSVDPVMIHVNVDCLRADGIKSLSVAYHDAMETVPSEYIINSVEYNMRFNRRGSGSGSIDLTLQSNMNVDAVPNIVTPPGYEESAAGPFAHPNNEGQFSAHPSPFHAGTPQHFLGSSMNSTAGGQQESNDDDKLWSAVAEGFYDNEIVSAPTSMTKRYSTFNKDSFGDL
jgi:hypothetical protein